ncbi:F-box protein [Legionella sp. WA2022007384]
MQEKTEDQLPEIPAEILEYIMTFLGRPRDLATLELVCKDWKAFASSDVVWKQAIGQTKEEFAHPELYTILTLPNISEFSYRSIIRSYALIEEELQRFFQNTEYVKQISFPEGVGNKTISSDSNPRGYKYKYENGIFISEEELHRFFGQARKESNEYTCYTRTEVFARYKEINDEIHLYALKHITEHKEWTIFQKPFIFNRNLVNNFPSVKPASTNTEDKTALPAQKAADSSLHRASVFKAASNHAVKHAEDKRAQPAQKTAYHPLHRASVFKAASNQVNQPKIERKAQPLATGAAYQPQHFQPAPKPAPARTPAVNRAPICLPNNSGSCTIS